jgi:ATP-dependent RNA helicase DDX19/DBP5
MSSETPASDSLASRITGLQANDAAQPPSMNPPIVGTSSSWADEVASPVASKPSAAEGSSLGKAQVDGAAPQQGGSSLQEPEYEVEVKLSDIQADPNNPLYSVTSFEQLGGL